MLFGVGVGDGWCSLGWGGEEWRHMQGRAMCWVGYISLFTLVFVTCEDPLTRRQTGSLWQRHLPIHFPLLPFSFSHILHFCHFLFYLSLPLFTPPFFSFIMFCHPTNPHSPRTTCCFLLSTLFSLLFLHTSQRTTLSLYSNLLLNNHIFSLFYKTLTLLLNKIK